MLKAGDILVTRGNGCFSRMIRSAACLRDQPNLNNHVAIAHHQDRAGTWWVIEGRPGGVGWKDARHYIDSHYTTNNSRQEKDDEQRARTIEVAEKMLEVAYDWGAIISDAAMALRLNELWTERGRGRMGKTAPAHVVCSSLAAYVYGAVGLEIPTYHEPRYTTPADWDQFIIEHEYAAPRSELIPQTEPVPPGLP